MSHVEIWKYVVSATWLIFANIAYRKNKFNTLYIYSRAISRIRTTSMKQTLPTKLKEHDYVIKWKHFPRNWPFVRGFHRSPVNSPHKGQWRGASTFSLMCVWIHDWVNNREAGDLRRYRAHYDVIVMNTRRSLVRSTFAKSRYLMLVRNEAYRPVNDCTNQSFDCQ